MIGQTVLHYKIMEKLGEGGMGVVYKAEDSRLDRIVALKFLPSRHGTDQIDRDRFSREAKATAALNHPNVCVIYDINEYEDQQFIAMEYVEGKTLRKIIRDTGQCLDTMQAVEYAIGIADALGAAHHKGIVHRDIKSDNIMITPTNQVKILDFGLAKLKDSPGLTKTTSTLGTTAYMSPEHIQGKPVDGRSDIFSFGVVLYEMLAGELPFKGDYEQAVMYAILNEEPEPIQRYCPGLSSEFLHILNRALEKDPGDRYQSVNDMLIDLRRIKRDSAPVMIPSTAPTAPIETTTLFRRKKISAGMAAFVGSIIVAVIFIWFFTGDSTASRSEFMDLNDHSIAVMPFENLAEPGDSRKMGEKATDLLIANLAGSKYIDVVSRQRLYGILKLMGKEHVKKIDDTVASELATRAKFRWLLTGKIHHIDPNIDITTQLVDMKNGLVKSSPQVIGEYGQDLSLLMEKLAFEIKNDLSLPEEAAQKRK